VTSPAVDVRDSILVSKASVALGCGLLAAGLLACGGDGAPSTADLSSDLAILKQQQGFSDGEVRCVAEHARDALSGDELEAFADDLAELARTSSLTSMSADSQATLKRAITACAGG
jgi:hypothetical protein